MKYVASINLSSKLIIWLVHLVLTFRLKHLLNGFPFQFTARYTSIAWKVCQSLLQIKAWAACIIHVKNVIAIVLDVKYRIEQKSYLQLNYAYNQSTERTEMQLDNRSITVLNISGIRVFLLCLNGLTTRLSCYLKFCQVSLLKLPNLRRHKY